MNIQKSFVTESEGVLYVVPTPIGNLEDITFRALKILKSVALIAAEDTRNTIKLLNHFDIQTPLISYHEHNKLAREERLLQELMHGRSIAIVSDAGMPAISDPGYEIVKAAINQEFPVIVLPGASAALCALVGSGLSTNEFTFYGFLPRKRNDKIAELDRLKQYTGTIIFYESPYRVKETLQILQREFGGDRRIAIARELTKKFEEYIRGTIDEVNQWMEEHDVKGECCLVVEGNQGDFAPDQPLWWSNLSVVDHVKHYMEDEQKSSKEAIKLVAQERKMPKREVYQMYHVE
ncbi:16S rRNA (cytidine(1402)-2'-O)-methyltransferase [Virgibacillus soli]|uniref:16S rRNA (cytidine(1402)-2'-O)-methyltransferase n=1 Tax=Paracerasibacillus soli TaxID=480284 RepID=UPI0035E76422